MTAFANVIELRGVTTGKELVDRLRAGVERGASISFENFESVFKSITFGWNDLLGMTGAADFGASMADKAGKAEAAQEFRRIRTRTNDAAEAIAFPHHSRMKSASVERA